MNWIKGFDRIFALLAIPVFIMVLIWVLNDTARPHATAFEFLLNPNPAYQTWDEEHGEKYREHIDKHYGSPRPSIENPYAGLSMVDPPNYPVPPPDRYLPINRFKRIAVSVGAGIGAALLFISLLSGTTRLIRLVGRLIINGFKDQRRV